MVRKEFAIAIFLLCLGLMVAGCPKKTVMREVKEQTAVAKEQEPNVEKERAAKLEAERAMKEKELRAKEEAAQKALAEKQLEAEREKAARLEAERELMEKELQAKEEEARRASAEKELQAERERAAALEAERELREKELQAKEEEAQKALEELQAKEEEARRASAQKELEAERERIAKFEAEQALKEKELQAKEEEARRASAEKEKQKGLEETLVAKKYPGIEGEIFESKLLQDIHFDYDKYDVRPADVNILKETAALLAKYPSVKIQVEGHCDERGTVEYNLALGERRANSTKNYLVSLGISPNRVSTISYGKERPLDSAHNEEAWTKNRRVHFVIVSK